MLKLSDFFAPLGIINFSIFLAFIVCCEIIGFALAKTFIKKIPDFLRGGVWLLGLGLVIFLYFLSHFFISLAFPVIVICLLILLTPSIKIYLKEKGWRSLFIFLRQNFLPLFLLLPIIPLVFIKVSLPPYIWDEMAYHYISPSTLYNQRVWVFGSGTFENFPRILETAFIALFSLTKTYATARLLHFSIYITALIVVYKFLKDNFGQMPALVYFILMVYHGENLLLRATSGYIDVGTASLVMIGIICLVSFLLKDNIEVLIASAAFWGMAVGAKYSALIPLAVYLLAVFFLISRRRLFGRNFVKSYLIAILLFLVMGGYWYIKNFIYLGNPIYPFLTAFFGCRFPSYPSVSFGGWTMPFSLTNAPKIFFGVLAENKQLLQLFLLSIPLALFHFERKIKRIFYFLSLIIIVEILIAKTISGYEPRYFYHWQFLSIFLIILPAASLIDYKTVTKKFYLVFSVLLIIFSINNSVAWIREFYKTQSEPEREMEIQYALRKINIYQWIEQRFPKMKEVIFWCDRSQDIEDLVVFDPSLTWYSSEGLFRVFMTNCNLSYVTSPGQAAPYLEKRSLWLASLNACHSNLQISESLQTDDTLKYLESINNQLICNSKEVLPGLYRFPMTD